MHATHRIIRRGGGQIEKGSATASMARSPGPGARAMLGADWLKPPLRDFHDPLSTGCDSTHRPAISPI